MKKTMDFLSREEVAFLFAISLQEFSKNRPETLIRINITKILFFVAT